MSYQHVRQGKHLIVVMANAQQDVSNAIAIARQKTTFLVVVRMHYEVRNMSEI